MMKKVCVCFADVINLQISPSSLMSHPSLSAPSLLFPCGQRDWSAVPGFLSDVSRHKTAEQAHSDFGDEEFGYLATSFQLTGFYCSGCFWLMFQVVLDFFGVVWVVFGGLKLLVFCVKVQIVKVVPHRLIFCCFRLIRLLQMLKGSSMLFRLACFLSCR